MDAAETLNRQFKAAELETRFREALASGRTMGNVNTTDESGNLLRSFKGTHIFDL